MKKYGTLYSNLRVYYSRDFPTYYPDEIIDPNQSNQEKSEENKEIDNEIDKEGGLKDREKFAREIKIIIKNDFSFADQDKKEEDKKESSLTDK